MTNEKPRMTHEEAAKKAAEAIIQIMKDAGIELETPEYFVIPASIVGDILIASRAAIRERSLKVDTHTKLREALASMLKNMASLSKGDAKLISEGLHIIRDREEWKEALDKFYGVVEEA